MNAEILQAWIIAINSSLSAQTPNRMELWHYDLESLSA